jgi:hypothetical protein
MVLKLLLDFLKYSTLSLIVSKQCSRSGRNCLVLQSQIYFIKYLEIIVSFFIFSAAKFSVLNVVKKSLLPTIKLLSPVTRQKIPSTIFKTDGQSKNKCEGVSMCCSPTFVIVQNVQKGE